MIRRAEYLWRLFGVGAGYVLFGLGGMLMSATVVPVLFLVVRNVEARVTFARQFVHGLFWLCVKFLVLVRVIDLDIQGARLLRDRRNVMFVANHPSLLDVVILMSQMSHAQCVVKSKLWRNPFWGCVVRATGYIRNDDSPEKLIDECVMALRLGQNLIVFPEGGRTVPGKRPKFRRGFAHMALRAEADIVPVAIRCTPPFLTKGNPWFVLPDKRAHFEVSVHHTLIVREYAESGGIAIAARKLSRDVDQIIAKELGYE